LTLLLSIFVSDILPVFAIAGAGFLLARHVQADVRTLTHVVFYAALPCLVFRLIVTSPALGPDLAGVALLAVLTPLVVGALGYAVARAYGLDPLRLRAFLLAVMFLNTGNFGLPVVQFAFGHEALAHGTVFFLTGTVLTYTLGGLLAAGARRDLRGAVLKMMRLPALHGVVLAAGVLATGIAVPAGIMRPVSFLSDAALPLMMLVLGMQLQRAARPARLMPVALAVVLSLVASPLVALGLTGLLDVSGAARQAVVTLSSMPVAVTTAILALEFDLDADYVTSAIFVSTVASPLTLTPLIAYLR
jgi:predicted permease